MLISNEIAVFFVNRLLKTLQIGVRSYNMKIRTNIMNILASLTSGKTQDTKTNLTKPKTNGLTEYTQNFPGCKAGIISALKVRKMQKKKKKVQKRPPKRKNCCSKFPRKTQKQSRHCSETNCLNYLTPKIPS